jgi:hypothetical protein
MSWVQGLLPIGAKPFNSFLTQIFLHPKNIPWREANCLLDSAVLKSHQGGRYDEMDCGIDDGGNGISYFF